MSRAASSGQTNLGNLSDDHGDGYMKMSLKKGSRAASNFIALIPSRLTREMLANFFGVEF